MTAGGARVPPSSNTRVKAASRGRLLRITSFTSKRGAYFWHTFGHEVQKWQIPNSFLIGACKSYVTVCRHFYRGTSSQPTPPDGHRTAAERRHRDTTRRVIWCFWPSQWTLAVTLCHFSRFTAKLDRVFTVYKSGRFHGIYPVFGRHLWNTFWQESSVV